MDQFDQGLNPPWGVDPFLDDQEAAYLLAHFEGKDMPADMSAVQNHPPNAGLNAFEINSQVGCNSGVESHSIAPIGPLSKISRQGRSDSGVFNGPFTSAQAQPRNVSFGSKPKEGQIQNTKKRPYSSAPVETQWSQPHPVSNIKRCDMHAGLDAPAIELCTYWLKLYPSAVPDSGDLQALSKLTDHTINQVKQWFGDAMRRGVQKSSDSGYGSESAISSGSSHASSSDLPMSDANRSLQSLPDQAPETPTRRLLVADPASADAMAARELAILNASRTGTRASNRCKKTTNRALLCRSPDRPYQCTRSCGKRYITKRDWKRHEEICFPSHGWLCTAPSVICERGLAYCTHCPSEALTMNPNLSHFSNKHGKVIGSEAEMTTKPCERIFLRKTHLHNHLLASHPCLDPAAWDDVGAFEVKTTEFPKWCGFCAVECLTWTWNQRINHIAEHFEHGCDMLSWQDQTTPNRHRDRNTFRGDDDFDDHHNGGDDTDSNGGDDDDSSGDNTRGSAPKVSSHSTTKSNITGVNMLQPIASNLRNKREPLMSWTGPSQQRARHQHSLTSNGLVSKKSYVLNWLDGVPNRTTAQFKTHWYRVMLYRLLAKSIKLDAMLAQSRIPDIRGQACTLFSTLRIKAGPLDGTNTGHDPPLKLSITSNAHKPQAIDRMPVTPVLRTAGSKHLREYSKNFTNHLAVRHWTNPMDRPLIYVGCSLGGLIVRQVNQYRCSTETY